MTPKPKDKPAVGTINTKAILEFICGEVERQGFDLATKDGFRRVMWMANAWDYALILPSDPFCETHLLEVASRVEETKNKYGYRKVGVRVGAHIAPPAKDVPHLVERLFTVRDMLSADKFYLEFQHIHPFVDGNGRTGKILHNWLLGTLADPILIKDYFGGGNP